MCPLLCIMQTLIHLYWPPGRAIVRLEEFPPALFPARATKPIFAIRVLEVITPFRRVSNSGRVLDPVPGELLLMRRTRDGLVVPWSYTALKPDLRDDIKKWIAQPASPKHETS